MPRKPILAAASIVIGSTGAASGTTVEDDLLTDPRGAEDLIIYSADLSDDGIDLGLPLDLLDPAEEVGIDYAQTWGGGTGNDGVMQGPVKTPRLQDRIQTQQPQVNQPKLQTQPSVQGADQQPRKKRLRKKRVRK